MDSDTLADARTLNTLKNRLREATRVLDTCRAVSPDTLEAAQVKHAVVIPVSELRLHGLLPAQVHFAPQALQHVCE
jgi:hypothetical protein